MKKYRHYLAKAIDWEMILFWVMLAYAIALLTYGVLWT